MPTAPATLAASLEKHNDTFESLLRLIPAKYYLIQEDTEEQVRPNKSLALHDGLLITSCCTSWYYGVGVKVPQEQEKAGRGPEAGRKGGIEKSSSGKVCMASTIYHLCSCLGFCACGNVTASVGVQVFE